MKNSKSYASVLFTLLVVCTLITPCMPVAWADEVVDSESDVANLADDHSGIVGDETPGDDIVTPTDDNTGVAEEGIEPLEIQSMALNNAVVTIASALDYNRNQILDIERKSLNNSANVILYRNHITPNQRFRITQDSDGFYTITSVNSGKVLDVNKNEIAENTQIIQYDDKRGSNQRWSFVMQGDGSYLIVSKADDRFCLEVKGGSAQDNSLIVLARIRPNAVSQRFFFVELSPVIANGTYTICSQIAQLKAIDITSVSQSNLAKAIVYSLNGGLNQSMTFTYVPENGYYYITAAHSGKVLDVEKLGSDPGTAVIQYAMNGGYNQLWDVRATAAGIYSIRSACNDLSLDLYQERTADLTPIIVWTHHGRGNQQWRLNPTSLVPSTPIFLSLSNGSRLEVPNNQNTEGTQTRISSAANVLHQRFYLTHLGGDIYVIESMSSGKRLGIATSSNTGVGIFTPGDSSTQRWQLIAAGNSSFYIVNLASNLYLGTQGLSTAAGASSILTARADNAAQKWSYQTTQPLPDGAYVFFSGIAEDRALDNPGQSMLPDVELTIWPINRGPAQRFQLQAVAGYNYKIVNMGSGLTIQVRGGALNTSNGAARVVQNSGNGSSAAQQWQFEYVGNGYFRILSALNGGRACLTVDGNNSSQGTQVSLLDRSSGVSGQLFKPENQGNTTYVSMNVSLDTFVAWQGVDTNGYYNTGGQAINPINPNHNADRMTQFQDLRRSTGLSAAQLDAYIDSTADGRAGLLHGKGSVIVSACNQYGINETYFLAHAILESGWGKWVLGNGANTGYSYDGKTQIQGNDGVYRTYPAGTYYNFFGIGAYDSSPLSGGRAMAIKNGWNSVDKAIAGAAKWIAENYIYGYGLDGSNAGVRYNNYPQPTLYAMKWDYGRSLDTGARGWHQYATDVAWARKISSLMDNCYSYNGANPNFYFIIPVFR